jgi:hypothetical protein
MEIIKTFFTALFLVAFTWIALSIVTVTSCLAEGNGGCLNNWAGETVVFIFRQ